MREESGGFKDDLGDGCVRVPGVQDESGVGVRRRRRGRRQRRRKRRRRVAEILRYKGYRNGEEDVGGTAKDEDDE